MAGGRVLMSGRSGPCYGFDVEVPIPVVRFARSFLQRAIDDASQGRQCADGVGVRGIARQGERLTAAPAEIDRLSRTTAAGLRHPLVASVRLKRGRLPPDPIERMVPNVVETQRGDVSSPMAGQRLTVRRDNQIIVSPAAVTGLWIRFVVVGQNVNDLHAAP